MDLHPNPRLRLAVATLALFSVSCKPAEKASAGPREVLITGTDYAFAHPDTLAGGPTLFRFVNAGKVIHEMNLGRLKPGATLEQVIAAGDKANDYFESWGAILIANPGETVPGSVLIDLAPGATYVLWCNFRDGPNAPPHGDMGMRGSIVVKG